MAHMMAPPALPAAPTGMVLNVEVPPLTIENAHGPSRFQAIAEFKARNLTVPVQLNDTIGHVYTQIEARYKRNYCNPKQTAAFAINKLQNADGFDLDVDDTVGSIFGCETDPKRRKIIVVHSFFDRDFSVPVDSNLRPAAARKRLLELRAEHANKRRRIQASSPPRDQPIPTTESEPSQENTPNHAANGVPAANRSSRAHTGDSMVYMEEGQTGKDEFPPVVKSESPELGLFPRQHTPESLSVEPVAALSPIFVREETQPQVEVSRPRETIRVSDSAMLHSPEVTPAQGRQARSRTSLKRKDIYDVPSSPDFVTKKPKPKMATYGRSPKIVEKEVDLLNSSRWESAQARKRPAAERLNKAHAFYFPDDDDDEIESTPQHEEALNRSHSLQNGVSIPYKGAPGKISKPGSLKKPSSSVMSNIKAAKQFAPSSSRQSIATPEKSTTSKISDPTVRARFAALREGRKALQVLDNSTENNDTGPATPAGRLTVNEEAVFAEPTVVARLSAQPSVPKTPVPLPANVGNLSQKGKSVQGNGTASNADVFKKPAPRRQILAPEDVNGHQNIGGEGSLTRLSDKPDAGRIKSLAATPASISNTPRKRGRPRTKPEPTPGPPKRRGRPPKNANSTPNPPKATPNPPKAMPNPPKATPNPPKATPDPPKATPNPPKATPNPPKATPNPPKATPNPPKATPNPPKATPNPPKATPGQSKPRGGPKKTPKPAAVQQPAARSSNVGSSRTESIGPSSSKQGSQAEFFGGEPIVISSAEPSSTDFSDEGEVDQDVPEPNTNGDATHVEPQVDKGEVAKEAPGQETNGDAIHEEPQSDTGEVAEDVSGPNTNGDIAHEEPQSDNSEVAEDVPGPNTNGDTAHEEPESDDRLLVEQLLTASNDQPRSLVLDTVTPSLAEDQELRSAPAEVEKSPRETRRPTQTWKEMAWSFARKAATEISKKPLSAQEANAPTMSFSQPVSNGKDENVPDAGPAREEGKSRSVSPAVSNRSSPALTRQGPARYISHTPTPKGSDAEDDDSAGTSASPSKATTPQLPNDLEDSDSDSEEIANNQEDSESDAKSQSSVLSNPPPSDVMMQNAPTPALTNPTRRHFRSSPPQPMAPPPKSTPIVPETSQPIPYTSSHLYNQIPLGPSSSQIPSTATPSGRNTHKSTATTAAAASAASAASSAARKPPRRQFTSLADQVHNSKKSAGQGSGKASGQPDLRNMDLSKLAMGRKKAGWLTGKMGKNGATDSEDSESGEESSSSNSSSD